MAKILLLIGFVLLGAMPKDDLPTELASPEAAEDLPKFEFRIQSVHVSSMVQFDENGNRRQESGNLGLSIAVKHGPEVFPTSYRNMKVQRIVTSAGEELKVQSNQGRAQMISRGAMGRANRINQFYLGLSATVPQWAAARISEISGTIEIECAVGPTQQVTLGPIKDIEGQPMSLEGVPECELTLRRQGANQVQIEGNAMAGKLLRNVQFHDAEGHELQCNGWPQHAPDDPPRWIFHVKATDQTTIRVELQERSRSVEVPFMIRDVEMPRIPGAGRLGLAPNDTAMHARS